MTGPDTGLDLESFLLLMRADPGAWALLGLGTLLLGLLAWLSWGSRRATAQVPGTLGCSPRGTCPLRQHCSLSIPAPELSLA